MKDTGNCTSHDGFTTELTQMLENAISSQDHMKLPTNSKTKQGSKRRRKNVQTVTSTRVTRASCNGNKGPGSHRKPQKTDTDKQIYCISECKYSNS